MCTQCESIIFFNNHLTWNDILYNIDLCSPSQFLNIQIKRGKKDYDVQHYMQYLKCSESMQSHVT